MPHLPIELAAWLRSNGANSRRGPLSMFVPLHDANRLKHIRLQYVTLAIIAANVLIFLGVNLAATEAGLFATVTSLGYTPAVVNDFGATGKRVRQVGAAVALIVAAAVMIGNVTIPLAVVTGLVS